MDFDPEVRAASPAFSDATIESRPETPVEGKEQGHKYTPLGNSISDHGTEITEKEHKVGAARGHQIMTLKTINIVAQNQLKELQEQLMTKSFSKEDQAAIHDDISKLTKNIQARQINIGTLTEARKNDPAHKIAKKVGNVALKFFKGLAMFVGGTIAVGVAAATAIVWAPALAVKAGIDEHRIGKLEKADRAKLYDVKNYTNNKGDKGVSEKNQPPKTLRDIVTAGSLEKKRSAATNGAPIGAQSTQHSEEISHLLKKELTRDNTLLTTALAKGKLDDVKFIMENKLYKHLTKKDILNVTYALNGTGEMKKVVEDIVKHGTPHEIAKMATVFINTEDKALGQHLVETGLKAFEAKGGGPVEGKAAHLAAIKMASLTYGGTPGMFEKAGIPDVNKFDPQNEAAIGQIKNFLDQNKEMFSTVDASKRGTTPLMFAMMSNNPKLAVIVAEAQKMHDYNSIGTVAEFSDKLTTAITKKEGESINHKQISLLIEGYQKDRSSNKVGSNSAMTARSFDKLDKLVNNLKTAMEQNKGDNELRKLTHAVTNQLTACKQRIQLNSNPFAPKSYRFDKIIHPHLAGKSTAIRPVDLMTVSMAAEIDKSYGVNPNKPGSLANKVLYNEALNRALTNKNKAFLLGMGFMAKWAVLSGIFGAVGVENVEHFKFIKMAACVKGPSFAALAAVAFLLKTVVYLNRRRNAKQGGLTPTLSQYKQGAIKLGQETGKIPDSGLKMDLPSKAHLSTAVLSSFTGNIATENTKTLIHAIIAGDPDTALQTLNNDSNNEIVVGRSMIRYFRKLPNCVDENGKDVRGEILAGLAARCTSKDSQVCMQKLFREQINAGFTESVKDAISIMNNTLTKKFETFKDLKGAEAQNARTNPEFQLLEKQGRGLIISAARLGDPKVLGDTIKMVTDTFDKRHFRPLNLRGQPKFSCLVRLAEHKYGKIGYSGLTNKFTKILRNKGEGTLMHLVGKSNNKEAILIMGKAINEGILEFDKTKNTFEDKKRHYNHYKSAFDLSDRHGKTMAETVPPSLATLRELDEAMGIPYKANGSLSKIHLQAHEKEQIMGVMKWAAVLPAKGAINAGGVKLAKEAIKMGIMVGQTIALPGSEVITAGLFDAILGFGSMAASFVLGFALGEQTGEIIAKMRNMARGFDNQATIFHLKDPNLPIAEKQKIMAQLLDTGIKNVKEDQPEITKDVKDKIKNQFKTAIDDVIKDNDIKNDLNESIATIISEGKDLNSIQKKIEEKLSENLQTSQKIHMTMLTNQLQESLNLPPEKAKETAQLMYNLSKPPQLNEKVGTGIEGGTLETKPQSVIPTLIAGEFLETFS